MRFITLLVLLLAAFPVRAAPTAGITGNDLYTDLQKDRLQSKSEVDLFLIGRAKGFVEGVGETLNGVRHPRTGFMFCLPNGVTRGQVLDIVLRYLENNPQERHLTASSLVQKALDQAFPCKSLR